MPVMSMQELKAELLRPTVKNVILDTDAYNEIDDQYAIAYSMLSPDRVKLLSINAAPFLNSRSTSAGDGMEKSYNEIFRIMKLVDPEANIPVYRGSTAFMTDVKVPVESEAADNIINTVMNSDELVYIVAIGAITNVASALVKCPEIADKAVLIWLGGHALHWQDTKEFNLRQDVPAAQVVFNSGIAFVQIPCNGVCTEFVTTIPEVDYYLKGKNALCDYLLELTANYNKTHENTAVWSKVIWDVTAVAAIVAPETLDMVQMPRPIVTDSERYAFDSAAPHYVYVRRIKRDMLYTDLFQKLSSKQ